MHIFLIFLNLFQIYGACFYKEEIGDQVSDECLQKSLKIRTESKTECILYCQRHGGQALMKGGYCYCVDEAGSCQVKSINSGGEDDEQMESGKSTPKMFKKASSNCWKRLTDNPVCYGTKDESSAVFKVRNTGWVKAIKLEHRSGYCQIGPRWHKAYWGLNKADGRYESWTFITDTDTRDTIFPVRNHGSYSVNMPVPTRLLSKEFILPAPDGIPYHVTKGKVFRIWFGEDLFNRNEDDNTGVHCVVVYALYD